MENNIYFGKINFYGTSKMPIIELCIDDKTVGYLSPFRGYKFQVSGTLEGQRDIGSSQVIGLGNVWNSRRDETNNKLVSSNLSWEETRKELLKGQAMIALFQFQSFKKALIKFAKFGKKTLSNGEEVWVNDDLDYFIKEVAIWLNSMM